MFSRTLAHGNSKIEIRQLKIKGKKARETNECENRHSGHENVPSTYTSKVTESRPVTSVTHDNLSRSPDSYSFFKKSSIYPFTLVHVRNTHVGFSCGFHFSSDLIYEVGALTMYRHLN